MKEPHYLGYPLLKILEANICFSKKGYRVKDIPEIGMDVDTFSSIKKQFKFRKGDISKSLEDYITQEFEAAGLENPLEDFLNKQVQETVDYELNSKFDRSVERLKKNEIDSALKIKYSFNQVEDFIGGMIQNVNSIKQSTLGKLPKFKSNGKELTVLISDIHFGKEGHEQVAARFKEVASFIIDSPERYINIIFSGDLVETLVPEGMHIGQVNKMDLQGTELANTAIELVVGLHLDILKAGKVIKQSAWLAGNHDRLQKDHLLFDISWSRTALLRIIQARLMHLKNCNFTILESVWNNVEADGFNFIVCHGDDKTSSKSPKEVEYELGRRDMFNIWVHGHYHYSYQEDTSKNMIRIQVGALAGDSDYAKNLLYNGIPSFVAIRKNKWGLPDVEVKKIGIFDNRSPKHLIDTYYTE